MGNRSLYIALVSAASGVLIGFGVGTQYAKDIAVKGIRGITKNYFISDWPVLVDYNVRFSEGLGGAFEQFMSGRILNPIYFIIAGMIILFAVLLATVGDDTS